MNHTERAKGVDIFTCLQKRDHKSIIKNSPSGLKKKRVKWSQRLKCFQNKMRSFSESCALCEITVV